MNFRIIPPLMLMCMMLVTYTHCLMPETGKKSTMKFENNLSNNQAIPEDSSNGPGRNNNGSIPGFNQRAASLAAFEVTAYPVTRNRCLSCHATMQQPFHASADVATAHDHIVDGGKVNFNNIQNSRLVLKLSDEFHNCWTNGGCEQDAQTMAGVLEDWKELVDEARAAAIAALPDDQGALPTTTVKRTQESRTLADELARQSQLDPGTVRLNMDAASLRVPMVRRVEGNTTYYTVPMGTGNFTSSTDSRAGQLFLNFMSPLSDTYRMWGLVQGINATSSSFFVRVNSGFTYEWRFGVTNGFQWRQLTHTTANLDVLTYLASTQSHVLEIRQRDDNARIAGIILTNDPDFNPNMDDTNPVVTMSYSLQTLTGVAGSRFEIDIEEYDAFSYKFSRPRVITPDRAIRVVNVRPVVNGQISPQNSTYTLVNQTVTAATPDLSNRSMIVLKDRGSEDDRFAFEFEIIEAN